MPPGRKQNRRRKFMCQGTFPKNRRDGDMTVVIWLCQSRAGSVIGIHIQSEHINDSKNLQIMKKVTRSTRARLLRKLKNIVGRLSCGAVLLAGASAFGGSTFTW